MAKLRWRTQGAYSRDLHVAGVRQEDLHGFKLENFPARRLGLQTELSTCKLTIRGDAGGSDISGSYWATSLWPAAGGKWLLQWHTETKAQ